MLTLLQRLRSIGSCRSHFIAVMTLQGRREEADKDVPRDLCGERVPPGSKEEAGQAGFRAHGKSKDSRDDLPQVMSGWPSPATGSRSGCGPGPGTPPTPA